MVKKRGSQLNTWVVWMFKVIPRFGPYQSEPSPNVLPVCPQIFFYSLVKLMMYRSVNCLSRPLYYTARLNAISANSHLFYIAVYNSPDILQIRFEPTFCYIVGMTHIITCQRFFPAYCTYSGHYCCISFFTIIYLHTHKNRNLKTYSTINLKW